MAEPVAVAAPAPPATGRFVAGIAAVIVLDQLVKLAVVRTVPLYDSAPLIRGLLDVTHVRNTGLAYGFLNESSLPYKGVLTTALALVALTGIALYARQLQAHEQWARRGLMLILGGALGNLIDRVRLGYVVDFVDAYWRGWHFWAFNVADAAITIGAVFVFYDLLVGSRHASRSVQSR